MFAGLTYDSVRIDREINNNAGRYFWWLTLRLDSEPGNSQLSTSCNGANVDCTSWDPAYLWVDIGWLAKALIFSAFPAFLVGGAIVGGFRRLGVSEVISFMISMPPLIASWYFLIGWLIDRYTGKRSGSPMSHSPSSC